MIVFTIREVICSLVIAFTLLCPVPAWADQMTTLEEADARKALAVLQEEKEIILYCGCCNNDPKSLNLPLYLRLDSVWLNPAMDIRGQFRIAYQGWTRPKTGEEEWAEGTLDLVYTWVNVHGYAQCLAEVIDAWRHPVFAWNPCAPSFDWVSLEPALDFPDEPSVWPKLKKIKVSTTAEFVAAVGSNVEIIMAPGIYDFSDSTLSGRNPHCQLISKEHYVPYWSIRDVQNLKIRGKRVTWVSDASFSSVMSFSNCRNMAIKGIEIAGTSIPEVGLFWDACLDVTIEGLRISGDFYQALGIYGCTNLKMERLQILSSKQALLLTKCRNVRVEESAFFGPIEDFMKNAAIGIEGSIQVHLANMHISGFDAAAPCIDSDALSDLTLENFFDRDGRLGPLVLGQPRQLTIR